MTRAANDTTILLVLETTAPTNPERRDRLYEAARIIAREHPTAEGRTLARLQMIKLKAA